MSLTKYIKKLILKEDKQLPYQEELHVSGLFVRNDIVAQNDVWVTKSVTGDIYCAKNIVVCKDVQVTGNIHCRQCVLEGKVKGNVSASEMIEIKAKAALNGNIITENLKVDPAAVLNGYVTTVMDGKRIYSDIKLKIEKINQLSIDNGGIENNKDNSESKIEYVDSVQNDNDGSKLSSEVSPIDIKPEKTKPEPIRATNNEKWW
jgi:cytoskeletal protein CcmA (bactofilin family)